MNMPMLSLEGAPSTIEAKALHYAPVRILEIEIGRPLPAVSNVDETTGQRYQHALCLIRLHTFPLGMVELELGKDGVSADECAQYIWHALQSQIDEHLRRDGLPPVAQLNAAALPSFSTPHCIEQREQFLASAPFVSIIIATRDRPDRLWVCLRSLLSIHYPHYEVIVVDNTPTTSATVDLVQCIHRDAPQVRYLREDRAGTSWARNCGIMAARGEVLAFIDDDVVVDPYWLAELVGAFKKAEGVGCVTGLVLPLELETPAQFWFEEYGGFSKGFTRRIFDMGESHPRTTLYPYIAGSFGTGASMAFRASFLRSLGGFDPALGADGAVRCSQDIAAFFQVVTRGYKLVYEPASLVYHLHRRDYAGLRKQLYNYGVGLTAYLTKSVFDSPRLLFDLMTKVPYGLFFIFSTRSPKNRKKLIHYPKDLTLIELKGMLYGPFAYLRSRRSLRHAHRSSALIEPRTTYFGAGNVAQ
jgi:GT2 family glycosyltransferase